MTGIISGVICIAIGISVGVFKQYQLIAGVNTMSKKGLEKIDLEYVGKYFGISFGILGVILLISPFIFKYIDLMKYHSIFFFFTIIGFVLFLFLFGQEKKNKIYKNYTTMRRNW